MSRAIAVCGGTSLGHAIAAVLAADPDNEVRVLTRQPNRWSSTIRAIYRDIAEVGGSLALVSDDARDVIRGAALVLICTPLWSRGSLLDQIAPNLDHGACVGGIPGFGGFDWLARRALGDHVTIFGLQRVPYVRKTISYGEAVWISGIRPRLYLGAHPESAAPSLATLIEGALSIPTSALSSYLPVSLSASNSIFHPARLMASFPAPTFRAALDQGEQFYEHWSDEASTAYLGLDEDIQNLARALGVSPEEAQPITEHFGACTAEGLTSRIRGIRALRDRLLPLRAGRLLDVESAYVQEDACFTLPVLKALAESRDVQTPWFDRALHWAEEATGQSLLADGHLAGPYSRIIPSPSWS